MEAKSEEDYKKGIQPLTLELTGPCKDLDCGHIDKRISDEASEYDELIRLLNDRLSDIESRSDAVSSLLTDQHNCMTSLSEIDQQVDVIPVNSLSSFDVDKQLLNLQVMVVHCI